MLQASLLITAAYLLQLSKVKYTQSVQAHHTNYTFITIQAESISANSLKLVLKANKDLKANLADKVQKA